MSAKKFGGLNSTYGIQAAPFSRGGDAQTHLPHTIYAPLIG